MLTRFERLPVQEQAELAEEPFDKWVTPDGGVAAEFRRTADGYLLRFPDQADFSISLDEMVVRGVPAADDAPLETLYRNAILPIIGNHLGELHMHGSAVETPWGAIAFMGLSRRGKTTLAGAFAKSGHPFLTEDTVSLDRSGEAYQLRPQRPVLRLFADSAAHLLGTSSDGSEDDSKAEIAAGDALPFASQPAPLRAIFLLGPGESETIAIEKLSEAEALTQLIQNAFVLDVEDKPRLRAHFGRIAALAGTVPCHALDYPRSYEQLPAVIEAVCACVQKDS